MREEEAEGKEMSLYEYGEEKKEEIQNKILINHVVVVVFVAAAVDVDVDAVTIYTKEKDGFLLYDFLFVVS